MQTGGVLPAAGQQDPDFKLDEIDATRLLRKLLYLCDNTIIIVATLYIFESLYNSPL